MKTIGDRLRYARSKSGQKVKDILNACGWDESARQKLYFYETNQRRIKDEILEKLAIIHI